MKVLTKVTGVIALVTGAAGLLTGTKVSPFWCIACGFAWLNQKYN